MIMELVALIAVILGTYKWATRLKAGSLVFARLEDGTYDRALFVSKTKFVFFEDRKCLVKYNGKISKIYLTNIVKVPPSMYRDVCEDLLSQEIAELTS